MKARPIAVVPRYVSGRRKLGKARGFSLGELKKAGLQETQARSSKIRIDRRRSTVHAHNVTSLNEFLASRAEAPPPEPSVAPSAEVPAVVFEPREVAGPRKRKAKASRARAAAKRKR